MLTSSISHRWVSSAEHTLQVKQDIKEKREKAKLGGGLKRIEAQHKRVSFIFSSK